MIGVFGFNPAGFVRRRAAGSGTDAFHPDRP
jgi:hypothetical protein